MISFIVPGEPVLFPRSSNGKFLVTPQCKRAYEAEVSILASKAMGGEPPLAGPVEVTIRAEYLIPRSWPEQKKETAVWKTTKSDADKLIKLCIDAMNKIVFADEAQIASLSMKKVYGPHARLLVSVRELSRGDCALAELLRIQRQTLRP
jgi:Holliday junction resolvase RusA-like endonuclease